LKRILKSLGNEAVKQIEVLDVGRTDITADGFQILSKHFISLKTLSLGGNIHLEDVDFTALKKNFLV